MTWQEQDEILSTGIQQLKSSISESNKSLKNSSLNALKGHAVGKIIALKDVSPVEHELDITLSSKNLFDISKMPLKTNATNGVGITEVGENYLIVHSPESATGNGYLNTYKTLKYFCPQLKAGYQITISATTDSRQKFFYLEGIKQFLYFGQSYTITEGMLDAQVCVYGFSITHGQSPGDCKISNIQIEYGTVATNYALYRNDLSSVAVTSLGKNLIPFPYTYGSTTINGVTFTQGEDGSLTLNGTSTSDMWYNLCIDPVNPLRIEGDYTFSWFYNKKGINGINFCLSLEDDSTICDIRIESGNRVTKTLGAYDIVKIRLYVRSGHTFTNVVLKPQLEYGTEGTEYEQYQEPIIVEPGVKGNNTFYSRYPSMTLIPNEDNVSMSCEYHRDLNKACEKLTQAIISLGGNI